MVDVKELRFGIIAAVVERDCYSTAERRDRGEELVIGRDVVHDGGRRPAPAAIDRPGEQDVRISGSEVRPRHEDGAGSFANGHPWEAVEAVRATWERFRDRDNRRDPPLHVECLAAVEGPGEQDLVLVEIFPGDVHLPSGADRDRGDLRRSVREGPDREDRGSGPASVRGRLDYDLRAVAPLDEAPRHVQVSLTD